MGRLRDIPFYFGRRDCKTSPDAREEFDFPNNNGGMEETAEWVADRFGFDAAQIVAILGAHTLGAAHIETSGYIGQWAGDSHVLNNEFFAQLAGANLYVTQFEQSRVRDLKLCTPQNDCGDDNVLFQWFINSPEEFAGAVKGTGFYLNVDIAMALRIEDHLNATTGQVSCTTPTFEELIGGFTLPTRCPYQYTVELVNAYGDNNTLWINDFADVWEDMIIVNEDKKKLRLLVVEYDRSFEDLYYPLNSTTAAPIPSTVRVQAMAAGAGDGTDGRPEQDQATTSDDAILMTAMVVGVVIIALMSVLSCLVYRRRKMNVLRQQLNESSTAYGTVG